MIRALQRSQRQNFILALSSFSFLFSLVQAQCNTDQNPYCRGNDQFEQLCCPYPNVCYWADRDGTPGCCPAGQVCDNANGGGGNIPPPDTTIYDTPTTHPLSTITSYVTHPHQTTPAGGVVVVTTNDPINGAWTTVTSNVAGAWSTVTSDVAGAFSTVTSDVAGGYETVTNTIGEAATGAATDIVQVINAAPARPQVSYQIPLAAGLGVALWQFA